MTSRALLVSPSNPYPVVRDGCQRLVRDYIDAMFPDHDMFFLPVSRDFWAPLALFRHGRAVAGTVDGQTLGAYDFEFLFFVGFKDTKFTRQLTAQRPSFCLTDTFPHPDVPRDAFRGILSHCNRGDGEAVLVVGGSYDDEVFHPDRRNEELVVSVGRIHPDKNQLELVARYRETVYEPYGLPLHLVGGAADLDYWSQVQRFVDGVAVVSSVVDPEHPSDSGAWRSASEIAELCNRARLFVSASPRESFGLALIEAMACGTTCVVNGHYRGFAEEDLQPNVYGSVTGKRGSVVDMVAGALRDAARIDASAWARRYSLSATRATVLQFIEARI